MKRNHNVKLLLNSNRHTASLGIIFLIVFIDLVGFGIVLPLLPLYARTFGASPLVIGLLGTCYSAAQFLFTPIWGWLSDRLGRRPILLVSVAGSVVSYTIFGWAPSLAWLFISRLAGGLFGANVSTAQAYIADITTLENRARGMGLVGAAFGIGFVVGPAIGGILSRYDYSLPGYAAAALSLLAFTLALVRLPESLLKEKREQLAALGRTIGSEFGALLRALHNSDVARALLVYFLAIFAFSNMQMTFPLFTQEVYGYDAAHNGYLFAFIGFMSATVQGGLLGRLSRRFGEGRLAVTGVTFTMLGLGLVPLAHQVGELMVLLAVVGLGIGLTNPTLTTIVSLRSDASIQGSVLGVSRSSSSLARMLGPLWGGWTYGALGINWPYWTAGIVLLVAVALALPLRRISAEAVAEEEMVVITK
jgi:DHA1 family tetracycline resistance protein-like MFS transporter